MSQREDEPTFKVHARARGAPRRLGPILAAVGQSRSASVPCEPIWRCRAAGGNKPLARAHTHTRLQPSSLIDFEWRARARQPDGIGSGALAGRLLLLSWSSSSSSSSSSVLLLLLPPPPVARCAPLWAAFAAPSRSSSASALAAERRIGARSASARRLSSALRPRGFLAH